MNTKNNKVEIFLKDVKYKDSGDLSPRHGIWSFEVVARRGDQTIKSGVYKWHGVEYEAPTPVDAIMEDLVTADINRDFLNDLEKTFGVDFSGYPDEPLPYYLSNTKAQIEFLEKMFDFKPDQKCI